MDRACEHTELASALMKREAWLLTSRRLEVDHGTASIYFPIFPAFTLHLLHDSVSLFGSSEGLGQAQRFVLCLGRTR